MNITKITPERDYLLVELVELQMYTPSGLALVRNKPTQAQPGMAIGKVLAAGPGFFNDNGIAVDVKFVEGDLVTFPAGAATMIEQTGPDGLPQEVFLLSARNVFASIEGNDVEPSSLIFPGDDKPKLQLVT